MDLLIDWLIDLFYWFIRLFDCRNRKALESRSLADDERITFLETQLKEAKYISEDADRKYDEVSAQYNAIQYNTIEYNTIQYNTIQHNTIFIGSQCTIK